MTKSEQARADAMADAETLKRWMWSCDLQDAVLMDARPYGGPFWRRTMDLQLNMHMAERTEFESNVPDYLNEVRRLTAELARAAFRAVPGLRG